MTYILLPAVEINSLAMVYLLQFLSLSCVSAMGSCYLLLYLVIFHSRIILEAPYFLWGLYFSLLNCQFMHIL